MECIGVADHCLGVSPCLERQTGRLKRMSVCELAAQNEISALTPGNSRQEQSVVAHRCGNACQALAMSVTFYGSETLPLQERLRPSRTLAEHEACEVSSSSGGLCGTAFCLLKIAGRTGAQGAWAMVFGYHSEMVIAACAWANRQ